MAVLGGETPEGLSALEGRRPAARLRSMAAADLVLATRLRARVQRYRVAESYAVVLRDVGLLTGEAAVATDAARARRLGLSAATSTMVDGYLDEAGSATAIQDCFLAPDVAGNATLRGVDDLHRITEAAHAVVIAVDLAELLNTRTSGAGRRDLDRLLSQPHRQP
jgi:hypothetical protein